MNAKPVWRRFQGMFNLNDGRWGRGDEPASNSDRPTANRPDADPPPSGNNQRPRGQGPNQGPPDLDELWRDFNRKLGGLFGGKNAGRSKGNFGGGGGGGLGGTLLLPCPASGFESSDGDLSSSRPQRGSFRLNMPWARCFSRPGSVTRDCSTGFRFME